MARKIGKKTKAKKSVGFQKRPQDQIFKLHLSLPGTEPLVWRRVLVPGHFTLEALHSVFQLAMGWQMSHLYDFGIGGARFAEPDEFEELEARSLASTLASVASNQKSFIYNYDFGDGWQHQVMVEDIVVRDERFNYPVCIGGENACPPEDCGGFPGYESLKKIIADSSNSEFAEMMQWLGGYFDPRSFDPNRINRDMLWMIDWRREPNDQGLYLPFNATDEE